MRVDGVLGKLPMSPEVQKSSSTGGASFGETIRKAVSEVNDLQTNADQIANKLAAGEAVEIHQAMIGMQKAVTAMQFTIQVRNKIIEAYQEIMRTQV